MPHLWKNLHPLFCQWGWTLTSVLNLGQMNVIASSINSECYFFWWFNSSFTEDQICERRLHLYFCKWGGQGFPISALTPWPHRRRVDVCQLGCSHTQRTAACVNSLTDNSGFQGIALRDVLRCVLLTHPVWAGSKNQVKCMLALKSPG